MTSVATFAPGTPIWVDLGSRDWTAATSFYGKLFSWEPREIADHDDHDWCYQVLSDGSKVAGIGQIKRWQPEGWTPFILTTDAAATAAAVQAAGGKILAEPVGGDEGLQAILADPDGAVFAVWQTGWWDFTAGRYNAPGALCWNELVTPNPDSAKAFYKQVFGWESREHDHGPAEWVVGGRTIGGMLPSEGSGNGRWRTYFGVANCDEAVAEVTRLGGAVEIAPRNTPHGRVAVLADPHGSQFALIQMR